MGTDGEKFQQYASVFMEKLDWDSREKSQQAEKIGGLLECGNKCMKDCNCGGILYIF